MGLSHSHWSRSLRARAGLIFNWYSLKVRHGYLTTRSVSDCCLEYWRHLLSGSQNTMPSRSGLKGRSACLTLGGKGTPSRITFTRLVYSSWVISSMPSWPVLMLTWLSRFAVISSCSQSSTSSEAPSPSLRMTSSSSSLAGYDLSLGLRPAPIWFLLAGSSILSSSTLDSSWLSCFTFEDAPDRAN